MKTAITSRILTHAAMLGAALALAGCGSSGKHYAGGPDLPVPLEVENSGSRIVANQAPIPAGAVVVKTTVTEVSIPSGLTPTNDGKVTVRTAVDSGTLPGTEKETEAVLDLWYYKQGAWEIKAGTPLTLLFDKQGNLTGFRL